MPPLDLLRGPILPTLARLAVPNVAAMLAATAVGIGETWYVGMLGKVPLAAMAVAFPFVMLVQMLSAGAMGGSVASAVSRALGAGDSRRATSLAGHALLIAVTMGLLCSALFLLWGERLYEALGARGATLAEAARYSAIVFLSALPIWIFNTLISIARGAGDMKSPSWAILGASLGQLAAGAALGLGMLGWPGLGMPGIAMGQVLAYCLATGMLWWYLRRRHPVLMAVYPIQISGQEFRDILRVGALSCVSPFLTVSTILVLTSLVAAHGDAALAGYGIGVRLEFLLIPIAFGVGVASLPMVGMAIGAGNVARARAVAWSAAAVSGGLLGAIGALVALWPDLWAMRFTADAAVLAHARDYLRAAGPAFAFFGVGLTLYFASQGGGKVAAPVAASALRFGIVALAGSAWGARSAPHDLFALVAAAMLAYGVATAAGVFLSSWEPRVTVARKPGI